METEIGTCSLCGGPVMQHTGPWGGIIPPTAHCGLCGAVRSSGPVIDMVKPRTWKSQQEITEEINRIAKETP